MRLFIGNKNYSSWSLRVWLTMKVTEIEFEEDLRPFDMENNCADFFAFSPSGQVPALLHEGNTCYESLAILEYLAELFPMKNLWPVCATARSEARCIAHEMHAGFVALRKACPMNMRRIPGALTVATNVEKDVRRVETIWSDCLDKSGGPFLFGEYSIADGMYAPLVNRLAIYELSQADAVERYTRTLTSLTPWQDWLAAAQVEPWVVEIDEV